MKKILMLLLIILLTACRNNDTDISNIDQTLYTLDISIEPNDSYVSIVGSIAYKNEISDLNELYLMFYPNAVRQFTDVDNVNISSLEINGLSYEDLSFVNDDFTALHIELEEVYQNDDILYIEFEYDFYLWDFDRMLMNEDNSTFYMMFFYPFVPVHDDTGWNIEPYTFYGETYYNEIGDYDVTIRLDSDYILASTGEEQHKFTIDGITTYVYYIEDARDYSFSASKNYKVYEKEIRDTNMKIFSLGSLGISELQSSWTYLEYSFDTYETLIGDYYYDNFILEYGLIYGMESTGIIYCSRDISEATVVHEVVHMWFFSMIGNDQYDNSFLDESITTYITSLYFYERYGEIGYNEYLSSRSSLQTRFYDRFNQVLGDSLLRSVDSFDGQYAYEIYYHGPTLFAHYIDIYLNGDPYEFARILGVYYEMYHKEIATLDNFLDLLESESAVPDTKEYFMMHLTELQDPNNTP